MTTVDMSRDHLMYNVLSDDPLLQAHFRVKFEQLSSAFRSLTPRAALNSSFSFYFPTKNKLKTQTIRELTSHHLMK